MDYSRINLTVQQLGEIKSLLMQGVSYRKILTIFPIRSTSTLSRIKQAYFGDKVFEKHPKTRLSDEELESIKNLITDGTPYRTIAAKYHLAISSISRIKVQYKLVPTGVVTAIKKRSFIDREDIKIREIIRKIESLSPKGKTNIYNYVLTQFTEKPTMRDCRP